MSINRYVKVTIEVGVADNQGNVERVDQQHPFVQFFGDDARRQIEHQRWLDAALTNTITPKMIDMGDQYIEEHAGKGRPES